MIIRAKAPLRLGLAGGGTDIASYYRRFGGSILNATIDMYSYCILEPREDGVIEFCAADIGEKAAFELDRKAQKGEKLPKTAMEGPLKLHAGVYNRISDMYGAENLSFTMTTFSDAPPGCGLGSSSTLVVAMIKAFVERLNLPLGEYEIASLACEIEREDLGLAGGKQDQYAATFGGFNFMEFYTDGKVIVNPLRLKRWIRNELEASLVLYHTGVSRESAKIIQRQIGVLDTESGRTQDAQSRQSIECMHELKRLSVVMKEALLKGNFSLFSRCLTDSWQAKRGIAGGISSDFIDDIYEYALSHGAESAKISGAGGGGFMMVYCNPKNRVHLIEALKRRGGQVLTPSFTEIGTQGWTIYNS